ncbi:MAG: YdcH family protein [Shimia sp.]
MDHLPGPSAPPVTAAMSAEDVLRVKLEALRAEHRDLDDAISALEERPAPDLLQMRRLKKQKLALKDQIARLEDRLTPDIIA